MNCPGCGNHNEDKAIYCGSCGARLPAIETVQGQGAADRQHTGPSPQICESCGTENVAGWRYCESCGAQLGEIKKTVALRLPLTAMDAPTRRPDQQANKKAPGGLAMIVGTTIAVGALALGSYFVFFNSSTPASPQPTSPAKTNVDTTTGPVTFHDDNDQGAGQFVAAFDPLVQKNSGLEGQIVALATDINKVGPAGITPSMIDSAANLETQLKGVKTSAEIIYPVPGNFSSSRNDFIRLVDNNISRSDALYRGAKAWSQNQPNYKDIFLEGQRAKEAYVKLLPTFEREYATAKTGS